MAKPQPDLVRSKRAAALLPIVSPEELFSKIKSLVNSVAVRAYELFESRGREHGRDWEDWFWAEGELLRPVEIKLSDSGRAFIAQANLAGFRPENIQVSLEPRCLRVSAQSSGTEKRDGNKSVRSPKLREQVFRVVALPTDVDTSQASATFEQGVLEVVMPRTTQRLVRAAEVGSHR
jgi:HSP20 family protein